MKIYRPLGVLAGLILLLIIVGGLVRNLGAGLSCPDWPLCQGRIIPQFDIRVFAEYFHRLFAAAVSILTLFLAVLIFSTTELRHSLARPMGVALALLFSQVILGGLTVIKLLQSEIVTLHLATGSLFFLTILFMTLRNRQRFFPTTPLAPVNSRSLLRWGCASMILVYLQIVLGGVVSSHYAGLACPDFPRCREGLWFPMLADGNVHIQIAHRLGAVAVFCTVLVFAFKTMLSKSTSFSFRTKGVFVLVFLFWQVALGILNVVLRLPVALSVTHLAVAECLVALILINTYEIGHFKIR